MSTHATATFTIKSWDENSFDEMEGMPKLTRAKVAELEQTRPDIVLLCGGTNGGDEENILYNASVLTGSALDAPFIVAGNETTQEECLAKLRGACKSAFPAANLLPEVGRVDVDEVHRIIRELFIARITHAKGIDRVRDHLNLQSDIVPTPSAVLAAARLLADGTTLAKGIGDIVLVDVGGATTDVYSVASGTPTRPGVITRGLPELRLKRTVEGDLGMRINAPTIVQRCGTSQVLTFAKQVGCGDAIEENDVSVYAAQVSTETGHVPTTGAQRALDLALGRCAVALAVRRHVGSLREVYTPTGAVLVQEGKDLADVAALIGVGGVFANGGEGSEFILEGALSEDSDPFALLPRNPSFYLDQSYVLYGVGLMSEFAPEAALAIAGRSLSPLER